MKKTFFPFSGANFLGFEALKKEEYFSTWHWLFGVSINTSAMKCTHWIALSHIKGYGLLVSSWIFSVKTISDVLSCSVTDQQLQLRMKSTEAVFLFILFLQIYLTDSIDHNFNLSSFVLFYLLITACKFKCISYCINNDIMNIILWYIVY